ncbi:sensory neuron membrane protein 1-like [Daktulosphaira vitifoliae]|uniref:sensory neuron membrane protein 1-like n=1 Tax=Daktulosphaira vitifoliae TaxID=58002 RepID=UPI0021AAF501|nr:sensory neuron membrane protein 1-like [Daktulosphaira vitifoliae]
MGAPTKLTVTGIIFLLIGVLVGWFVFPSMIHDKLLKSKALNPSSKMREMWSHPPLAADFKIYLFNVTNYEEANQGGKIVLKEIGPYFYHEWKEKENLVDDADDDTVEFSFKNTFIFDREKSKPLNGEEIIIMPHMAILGMVTMTKMIKPAALGMINKAIPFLYPEQDSIFLKATANQIMWTGVDINCTSTEFSATAVCSQIRENSENLHKVDNNHFMFSLLGVKNGTIERNRYTVKRGYKSPTEVGQVIRFNGKEKLNVWPDEECNRISGSDTTIFQSLVTRETNLGAFSGDVCRSVVPDYVQDNMYNGLNVYEYTAEIIKDHEKCYCLNPEKCLKSGVLDLTKCAGAPIMGSLPHFYKAEAYVNDVIGLNPNTKEHAIKIFVEPMTGTPVVGFRRMQFSMFLTKESKISIMKNLSEEERLVPMFWIEEGLSLNKTWTGQIKNKLFLPIKIVKYVKYVIVFIGVMFIVLALVVNYNSVKTMEVTPNN